MATNLFLSRGSHVYDSSSIFFAQAQDSSIPQAFVAAAGSMEYADPQEDSGNGEDDLPPSSSLSHPDKYNVEHISNLEVFSQDLQKAIANSFPRPSTLFTSVHVLLLRWVEDDLNVQEELTALKAVFDNQYGFATEQWNIPSQNSTRALQSKLYDFQNCHQSEDELLIVYYGGHGDADRRRGRSIWAANKKPESPTLTWSSLQHLLENAIPHVLIILDCCYAANAARDTSEGTTKELLAASGRENPTLGVGIRSFTSALIEELEAFGRGPFTVAMLHSRLITMRWRLAFTPVYALLSEHGGHSIELAPLPALTPAVQPTNENDSDFDHDMMDISSPEARVATATRVRLAVSISDDAACDIAEWKKWLVSQAPLVVTQIEVEGVFKSHSTMPVISLPIALWDCLPDRAAYRFIDFVKSENLDQSHLKVEIDNERLAATSGGQKREIHSRKQKRQYHLEPPESTVSKNTPFVCVSPGCTRQFARPYDLDRHMRSHFTAPKFHCPHAADGSFGKRFGVDGFSRKDHLNEHLKKVHMIQIQKSPHLLRIQPRS
ncbi:MAG: hypothetical protein Q9171_000442 [Xanthocarpia ochracea]